MMSFYSVGGAMGPTYYSWALEEHTWKFGLMTMGAATFAYGLFLVWGLKAKYTDRAKDVKSVNIVHAFRAVGSQRGVWVGISIALLTIFSYWGFGSMGPYLFITYKGFTAAMVGKFFAVTYGIGGLSAVLMGYFSDKFGRKPVILTLALLNAICFYLIIHVIPITNMPLMYIVGGILGIGLHAGSVLGYCVAQDSVPLHQVGLAQGLAGSVSYGSTFISGPAVGYLTKVSGYLAALDVVCIGGAVLMVVIAFFMKETHKKPAAGQ
jgi:MFS family permease